MVYRLLTNNTYEMEMFRRSCEKLTLDKLVLQSIKNNTNEKEPKLDKKEVELMLKQGAYAVFSEESEQRMREFHESDITSIIERSEVRRYETEEDLKMEGSFSTATFLPANSDQAVRLDDPDFWSKVGIENKSINPLDELILAPDVKRERKMRKVDLDYDESPQRGKKNIESSDDEPTHCAICLKSHFEHDNQILLCDGSGCNLEYHQLCLVPPLRILPDEDKWFCPKCVKQQKKKVAKKRKKDKERAEASGRALPAANKNLPLPPDMLPRRKQKYNQVFYEALSYFEQRRNTIVDKYNQYRQDYSENSLKLIPELTVFLRPRSCSRPACKKVESPEVLYHDAKKFSVCGRCLQNAYCSVDCQKSDWQSHATKCIEANRTLHTLFSEQSRYYHQQRLLSEQEDAATREENKQLEIYMNSLIQSAHQEVKDQNNAATKEMSKEASQITQPIAKAQVVPAPIKVQSDKPSVEIQNPAQSVPPPLESSKVNEG